MNLSHTESRGVHILSLTGELALGKGDTELPVAVRAAIEAGARRIVLSLVRLGWMDSSGVGAIVACGEIAAEAGAIVRLAVPAEGAVRRVVDVTCLDRAFEVFEDAESAAKGFGA